MKKRTIFSLIILIGTILQFVLSQFVFEDFPAVLSYILIVPFYVIVYVYYPRYKIIRYIIFVSIFTVMAYTLMMGYLDTFPLYSRKIRLLGMVSFFGSIFNNILAFILLLQVEPKSRWLRTAIVFIVITNYFFFSYYIFSLTNLLIAFFGPDEQVIDQLLVILQIVIYALQFFIMIAQIIIIHVLDDEEEYYGKATSQLNE